jgi:hypothetical protein
MQSNDWFIVYSEWERKQKEGVAVELKLLSRKFESMETDGMFLTGGGGGPRERIEPDTFRIPVRWVTARPTLQQVSVCSVTLK